MRPLLDGPISIIEMRGNLVIPADSTKAKFNALDKTDLPQFVQTSLVGKATIFHP